MDNSILIENLRKLGISCSDSPWDLAAEGRDNWVPTTVLRTLNSNGVNPAVVCWPENTLQVASLARFAMENKRVLIPSGAYTSLTGSVQSTSDAIIVNMRRMKKIWFTDKKNRFFRVQAGVYGSEIENFLRKDNLSFGHMPSSFEFSTPGGWLSTGSAGLFSSRFGKVQNLCRSIKFVSGTGEIFDFNNYNCESDYMSLILGSEGTFGIITEAEFEAHASDSSMEIRGIHFQTLEDGLVAMKKIIQSGLKPSILRLYDPFTSLLALSSSESEDNFIRRFLSLIRGAPLGWLGHKSLPVILKGHTFIRKTMDQYMPALSKKGCLMIIGFHGSEESDLISFAAVESVLDRKKITKVELKKVQNWYQNRNSLAFKRNHAFNSGVFTDTMEISATWNRIPEIYRNIKSLLSTQAFTGVHFSHAWPEGACIYFTFAREFSNIEQANKTHKELWASAMKEVIRLSGGISHHHGVGRLKKEFYTRDVGDNLSILSIVKNYFDPAGIMNKGNLIDFKPIARSENSKKEMGDSWMYFRDLVGRENCFERDNYIELKPSSVIEVSRILRECFNNGYKVHVLPPSEKKETIIVNPEKLNKILYIDKESLIVHVQTGITIQNLEESLQRESLTLGVISPSENNLSLHEIFGYNIDFPGFINGFHGNRITGFNAICWNGNMISSKSVPSKSHGPDLWGLIAGKNGKYALVTDVHLKVYPLEISKRAVQLSFYNGNDVVDFISYIYKNPDMSPHACIIYREGSNYVCYCYFLGNSIITGLQVQNIHSFPSAWFETDCTNFSGSFQCQLYPEVKPLNELRVELEENFELISISRCGKFSIYKNKKKQEGTYLREFQK
ncbi:FAD-binding protein [Myxococcota bacterium]|nr:FAD-binding protein [Myxococcota bacterium]MBU1380538.1 FAD-binding protein [Myxococcota bacterium]MBU1497309.1 FAD-binding protein [Myxococcota bacterium]